jgi:release factor glutamine methyltransferase
MTDLSAAALEVASANAEKHGLSERVDLVEGDLLEALEAHAGARSGRLHYLVSNPPYIPDDEWDAVEPNVKDHEPEMALRGGADGLDLVRPILEGAPGRLCPGGLVLVEVADARAEAAAEIARAQDALEAVEIIRDQEGFRRVIRGRRA